MNMTLSKLKETAELYEWALVHNSWFQSVPDFQSSWRKVNSKNTVGLTLLTYHASNNGKATASHIDWPKASETTITHDSCHWVVTINRVCKGGHGISDKVHTMIYHLRPNLDLIAA